MSEAFEASVKGLRGLQASTNLKFASYMRLRFAKLLNATLSHYPYYVTLPYTTE